MFTVIEHKKQRGQRHKVAFVNDEHVISYSQALRNELPPWDGTKDPQVFMQEALHRMERTVVDTAPSRCIAKKPWLTDATWSLLYRINRWRRLITAWHRRDWDYAMQVFAELEYPSFGPLLCIQIVDEHTPAAYLALASIRVKIMCRQSRKALRQDRRQWFNDICGAAAKESGVEHVRALHAAVRLVCTTQRYRGRQVADGDGVVYSEPSQVNSLWHEHWGKHFAAHAVPAHNFVDRLQFASSVLPHAQCDTPDPLSSPAWEFSESDVLRVLQRMPTRRATADVVPSRAYTAVADMLHAPLCALFNKCLRKGDVPLAYAGARVVPVWKKKGSAFDRAAYRPVSLLTLEAKLLAKMCLRMLESKLAFHHSQYGTGCRCGIEYHPQASVIQLAALARASRFASATLFVDVKAAFDSVAHPIVWGMGSQWNGSAAQIEESGYSASSSVALAAFLHAHPAILARVGIPLSVVDILRVWGSSVWMVAEAGQSSAWRPHTGVPQGHNLAALIFDIFYSEIMQEVDRRLLAANVCVLLPRCEGRSLAVRTSQDVCQIGSVAFRDDFALAIMDERNEVLLEKLVHAAGIVAAVHSEFHLHLNWAPSKTEATVKLCSGTAKALMTGLRRIGNAAGLKQPAVALECGQNLVVSACYPHLGRQHAQDLKLTAEVKQRLAKAHSAFASRSKVFASKEFSVRTKLQLLRTYVVCHLLQNSGVSPAFSDSDYHRLRSAYYHYVRQVVKEHATSVCHSLLTDSDICIRFDVPSFLTLVDRTRLNLLRRLLIADTAPMQALLAAAQDHGSVWSGMLQSLRRLHKSGLDALSELPVPTLPSLPQWIQFVLSHLDSWKSLVRQGSSPDPPRVEVRKERATSMTAEQDARHQEAATDLNHVNSGEVETHPEMAVVQPENAPGFPCTVAGCAFTGKSLAGLRMHERRAHAIQSELASRITTPKCPCCHLVHATRDRCVDHLRHSARCKRFVEQNVPALNAEGMKLVYQANRGIDLSASRMIIPKPGPKPPGERPPCNFVEPAYISEDHRRAAVLHLD
eukprot:1732841-Amphidinium_carterae.1